MMILFSQMTGSVDKILKQMRVNPGNISFSELCKVCQYYFGEPRQQSGSHRIYKTPWHGDPRINIQNDNGKAKIYQVGQVLKALNKLEAQNGNESEETG
jgi:hypothetical protein